MTDRKTAIPTAQIWFDQAHNSDLPWRDRLINMENAFNHTENALYAAMEALRIAEYSQAAMSEIKATVDGGGAQSVEDIVNWCVEAIANRKRGETPDFVISVCATPNPEGKE